MAKSLPKDKEAAEIEHFLTHLAVAGKVAVSVQNQALCALMFFCKHILHIEINEKIDALRAKSAPKDRVTLLPERPIPEIENQLHYAEGPHDNSLRRGYGSVYLPNALARKPPNAVDGQCYETIPWSPYRSQSPLVWYVFVQPGLLNY